MTTQLAPRKKDQVATIKDLMEGSKDRWASLLPKEMSPERLMKVALMSISRNNTLLQCSPQSLREAFIDASTLGLDCTGTMGEAYLVPYKGEAKFIIGYKGLIALARRSGQIESIEANVVYQNDHFELDLGTQSRIVHRPNLDGDRGPLRLVYAVAKLAGGQIQTDYMTRQEIDAIRQRSRASSNGPWVTDYNEMARKTVVRRLAKYLPLSVESKVAISESDNAEFSRDFVDADIVETKGRSEATLAAMRATQGKTAIPAAHAPEEEGDDSPPWDDLAAEADARLDALAGEDDR
jgi:recombination protein RecT